MGMLNRWLTSIALVYATASLAGPDPVADQDAGHAGKVLRYGLYRLVKPGRTVAHDETATGRMVRGPTLELREQTDRIPLRQGLYFAYQYRLPVTTDKPWADLERVLQHPPMRLPDGTLSTGSRRMIRKRVSAGEVFGLDGYALIEAYELVPGEWRFQLWESGVLRVEQTFTLLQGSR